MIYPCRPLEDIIHVPSLLQQHMLYFVTNEHIYSAILGMYNSGLVVHTDFKWIIVNMLNLNLLWVFKTTQILYIL